MSQRTWFRLEDCLVLLLLASLLLLHLPSYADNTWAYTVQISAVVQADPPSISLSWLPDPYGVQNNTVYRKTKESTDWGNPIAELPGSATNYVDSDVVLGTP